MGFVCLRIGRIIWFQYLKIICVSLQCRFFPFLLQYIHVSKLPSTYMSIWISLRLMLLCPLGSSITYNGTFRYWRNSFNVIIFQAFIQLPFFTKLPFPCIPPTELFYQKCHRSITYCSRRFLFFPSELASSCCSLISDYKLLMVPYRGPTKRRKSFIWLAWLSYHIIFVSLFR